jgi:hypothetical protein
MLVVLDAQVETRPGLSGHEDVDEQKDRLSGELWKEYEAKWLESKEHRQEPARADLAMAIRSLANTLDKGTARWTRQDVVAEPTDPREIRIFLDFLRAWTDFVFVRNTRATSTTSTPLGFYRTSQRSEATDVATHRHCQESKWTDEKNRRRCELVDKEIEETLSSADRRELEMLQAEMLAYRRKVAPLPLDDLRKLHEELFGKLPKE